MVLSNTVGVLLASTLPHGIVYGLNKFSQIVSNLFNADVSNLFNADWKSADLWTEFLLSKFLRTLLYITDNLQFISSYDTDTKS